MDERTDYNDSQASPLEKKVIPGCLCLASLVILSRFLASRPKEKSIEISCSCAGLQGQDTTAVLGQVEMFEHVK